jgi:hypothetical protein
MKRMRNYVRSEVKLAARTWSGISRAKLLELRNLVQRYHVSVSLGDVLQIADRWYITHAGLLRLAHRRRCLGIKTTLENELSDPVNDRWIFKAIVFKSRGSRGFTGYGDASPANTSPLVRGAEMRVAETRAVNRALRKAYGIGLCSVEELGSQSSSSEPPRVRSVEPKYGNGSTNDQPRLRDKLCLLIRKYGLDSNLVKRYAADFCGTETLRDAGRDLVEAFVSTIAEEAVKDRAALLCKLNSYSQPEEVKS